MADNIDASKLSSPKPTKSSKPSKPGELLPANVPAPSNSSRVKEIKTENKSRYSAPSAAQQGKQTNNEEVLQKLNPSKEEVIKMTNPVLAAKLAAGKLDKQKVKKIKKTPPNPSPKIAKKLGGTPINPRRNKPSVPGRLKGFFDDRIKSLDKLAEALKIDDKQIIDKYKDLAKSLYEQSFELQQSRSFAEILDLDLQLFENDLEQLSILLNEKIHLIDESDLQEFYTKLIGQLSSLPQDQVIVPILQLFLPLPFGFIFADPDIEFEEAYQELIEEDDHRFLKDEDKSDKDKDDENSSDPSVIMLIRTMNYNKILFILKYNIRSRKLKLAIKGSPVATELAIPIESNLEDVLIDDVKDIDYLLRLWRENVLKITESRVLKIKSTGALNPILLKACNSILQTIYESDIDLNDNSVIDGDYNLI